MGAPLPDRYLVRVPEQRTETRLPYRAAHEYPLQPVRRQRVDDSLAVFRGLLVAFAVELLIVAFLIGCYVVGVKWHAA